jgi:glutathione synthase
LQSLLDLLIRNTIVVGAMSEFVESTNMTRLTEQIKAWCGMHGLQYTDGVLNWSHAPITVLPSTFSKSAYEGCQDVQPIINELVDKISRDREFIKDQLTSVASADPFTQKLLDLYNTLPEKQIRCAPQFGIHRSDYMLDMAKDSENSNKERALQIEINTIAASFGCLSQKVGELHKYLLHRNMVGGSLTTEYAALTEAIDRNLDVYLQKGSGNECLESSLPTNPTIERLSYAFCEAHVKYCPNPSSKGHAVILFIVQPGERNLGDLKALAHSLWTRHDIAVEFMSLAQIAQHARVATDSTGTVSQLIIRPGPNQWSTMAVASSDSTSSVLSPGELCVSVAYFRAGYSPDDYPSELEWEARALIERSSSIKCPSVGYQLVGTKKIQQCLFENSIMEKFITNKNASKLRLFFASQYAMGPNATPEGLVAMERAIEDGSSWVLKPQREGGGNNYYGTELSAYLKTHRNDPILGGFILMQRIFPATQNSVFFIRDKLSILPSISELGIYGTYISAVNAASEDDDSVVSVHNEVAGYLLRTKPHGVDEGGVAAGSSSLDSIMFP